MLDVIADHFRTSIEVLQRACADPEMLSATCDVADRVARALRSGHKVLLAGNGGSAADAQHIAAELIVRYRSSRQAFSALALTTDSSVLTAVGNDFSFDEIFARQVRGLGRPGDVFIGISTSGRSVNVLRALQAARELGLTTIGFSGTGPGTATMRSFCDLVLAAPSQETAIIQQIHITAAHAICAAVEINLSGMIM